MTASRADDGFGGTHSHPGGSHRQPQAERKQRRRPQPVDWDDKSIITPADWYNLGVLSTAQAAPAQVLTETPRTRALLVNALLPGEYSDSFLKLVSMLSNDDEDASLHKLFVNTSCGHQSLFAVVRGPAPYLAHVKDILRTDAEFSKCTGPAVLTDAVDDQELPSAPSNAANTIHIRIFESRGGQLLPFIQELRAKLPPGTQLFGHEIQADSDNLRPSAEIELIFTLPANQLVSMGHSMQYSLDRVCKNLPGVRAQLFCTATGEKLARLIARVPEEAWSD